MKINVSPAESNSSNLRAALWELVAVDVAHQSQLSMVMSSPACTGLQYAWQQVLNKTNAVRVLAKIQAWSGRNPSEVSCWEVSFKSILEYLRFLYFLIPTFRE